MIASHSSAEPGAQRALKLLGLRTILKYGNEIRRR